MKKTPNNLRKQILHTLYVIFGILALSGCSGTGIASSWPGITTKDEIVYVAYNQHIHAIDFDSTAELWRFPEEAKTQSTFFAHPVFTPEGDLIAGSYDHILYSIDPVHGRENWAFKDSKYQYIASPLVTERGIFAPTAGQYLYAVDFNGKLKWEFKAESSLWATPVTDSECNCLYLPSMDHYIYALDQETGKLLWKTEKLEGSVVGTPAMSEDGILYFGSFASQMLALDSKSQKILWTTPTDGWVWGGPTLSGDTLYFGDLSGGFYAIDRQTGKIIWKAQTDGAITGTPLLVEEKLIIGTDSGTLYSFDLQGKELWKQTIAGKINASPQLHKDQIIQAIIGKESVFLVFDLQGNQTRSYFPEKK